MTVTTIDKDTEALTLTLIADFAAPVEAVWELWADPRKLERWWGPPTYPATFVKHDLTPGALVTYFMTSPEGDKHHGWWRIKTVDAPRHSVAKISQAIHGGRIGEFPTTRTTRGATDEGQADVEGRASRRDRAARQRYSGARASRDSSVRNQRLHA